MTDLLKQKTDWFLNHFDKNNPNSEFYYYDRFADWFERQYGSRGKDHRIAFCLRPNNLECDLVGGYKYKNQEKYVLVGIEVKLNNPQKALFQANTRKAYFDYCYVAFPMNHSLADSIYWFGRKFRLFKQFGIGFLLYDPLRDYVCCPLAATRTKGRPFKHYHAQLVDILWERIAEKELVLDTKNAQLDDFLKDLPTTKVTKIE